MIFVVDKSKGFDVWRELGKDAVNCDWDGAGWSWGRMLIDGVGVRFDVVELVVWLTLSVASDAVDWWIFDELVRSGTTGVVFVSSWVSQIVERSTSHDRSAVELQMRLVWTKGKRFLWLIQDQIVYFLLWRQRWSDFFNDSRNSSIENID